MKHLHRREGQSTLEYILIAAAVVVLAALLINTFKGPATTRITEIGNSLASSGNGQ